MDDKAQTFSIDMAIGISLFLVAFGVVVSVWTSTMDKTHSSETVYEMEWMSTSVLDQLMRSPGIPKDWYTDPTGVAVIGLAEVDPFLTETLAREVVSDRIIDPDKLLSFMNLVENNYSATRNKLFGTSYEFYVELSCFNKSSTDCFNGTHVDYVSENLGCGNGVSFNISGGTVVISGGTVCKVGNGMTVPRSDMKHQVNAAGEGILSEVFDTDLDPWDEGLESLNRSIRLNIILWV